MSDGREQVIRERAYSLWEKEGRPSNRSIDNWLQAEAELADPAPVGFNDFGKPIRSARSSGPKRKAG